MVMNSQKGVKPGILAGDLSDLQLTADGAECSCKILPSFHKPMTMYQPSPIPPCQRYPLQEEPRECDSGGACKVRKHRRNEGPSIKLEREGIYDIFLLPNVLIL
jgi:hypothetical protein